MAARHADKANFLCAAHDAIISITNKHCSLFNFNGKKSLKHRYLLNEVIPRRRVKDERITFIFVILHSYQENSVNVTGLLFTSIHPVIWLAQAFRPIEMILTWVGISALGLDCQVVFQSSWRVCRPSPSSSVNQTSRRWFTVWSIVGARRYNGLLE